MSEKGKGSFLRALKRAQALWMRFTSTGAGTHASSIAFFTFLSLIPLLALCISLISIAGINEEQVTAFFTGIVPDAFNDFTKTLVGDAVERSGIAFSLSTITLLWTASQGARALRNGLNAVLGAEESRSIAVVIGISFGAVIVLGVLLALTMYLVFGGVVMRTVSWLTPGNIEHDDALDIVTSVVLAIAGVIALTLCYAFLPAKSGRLAAQLPGAIFASVTCGLLTGGFRVYVDNFCNYDALYGNIATIALFLFWLYLVSYILLAGGYINRIIAESKREAKDK